MPWPLGHLGGPAWRSSPVSGTAGHGTWMRFSAPATSSDGRPSARSASARPIPSHWPSRGPCRRRTWELCSPATRPRLAAARTCPPPPRGAAAGRYRSGRPARGCRVCPAGLRPGWGTRPATVEGIPSGTCLYGHHHRLGHTPETTRSIQGREVSRARGFGRVARVRVLGTGPRVPAGKNRKGIRTVSVISGGTEDQRAALA